MGSMMDAWTESEREAVRAMMEGVYEDFLAHVVENRKMTRDDVHKIAQGRVWTGTDAKERGLVDEIGGLEAALAEARKLGGVGSEVGLEVYPGKPTIRDLITSFAQVQTGGVRTPVRAAVEELAALAGPEQARAVASILGLVEDLRDTKVWAVSWVQPLR
jgi:protease-4